MCICHVSVTHQQRELGTGLVAGVGPDVHGVIWCVRGFMHSSMLYLHPVSCTQTPAVSALPGPREGVDDRPGCRPGEIECNMTWHLDHWRTGMKMNYYITMLNGSPDLTVNYEHLIWKLFYFIFM